VPEPNAFEAEMPLEKPKTHKSAGSVHIPAEMIKAGGRTTSSEIHKLTNPVWKNTEHVVLLMYWNMPEKN